MDNIQENKIGQDFTTIQLLGFSLPSFFMNCFTQLFKSLDDALFISRYVGEKALAGLNLLNPLNCVQYALTHLFSLGSANISAKLMGEHNQDEAKQVFSKIFISAIFSGLLFALICNIFSTPILRLLGADDALLPHALIQIRYVYSITPITLINSVFSSYYSTAGKPKMGLICSIVSGSTNILLDIVLVSKMQMGVTGAAVATAMGEIVVFFIGLFFFININHEIHFVKTKGEYINTCLASFKYALPQFVNSVSIAVTSLITNAILLDSMGSSGIAANAIISDIRSIITSGLIGIAISISPVVAYNYGNRNPKKLKRILFSVLKIWFIGSLTLLIVGFILRKPLVSIFMSKDSTIEYYETAMFGLSIELFAVPFCAGCVTTSRVFIALSNTKVSTFISVFRNLVFKSICLIILPMLLPKEGIWLAVPANEFLSFVMCVVFIFLNRNNYGYGKDEIASLMLD